jgi:hypothetical protein
MLSAKLAVSTLALACASVSSPAWAQTSTSSHGSPHAGSHQAGSQHPPFAWEAGLALGHDFGTDQTLWAISLARQLGGGLKAVFEYADGRHGHEGSRVTSAKLMKEVHRWGHVEFGLGLGLAYVSEAHENGWGVLAAAEAVYPITHRLAAKLEVSRLFGVGGFNETRATVLQGGVIVRF